MNIALFLTPKREVVTLNHRFTIGEAMDVMAEFRYSSVPVIDKKGRFVSTLSEGDILWFMNEHPGLTSYECDKINISKIKRFHDIKPVSINAHMDSLIDLVAAQSFVPVVDDDNVFIGIIKRSDIINYTVSLLNEKTTIKVS